MVSDIEVLIEKELFKEMIDVLCERGDIGPVGMEYMSDKRIDLIRKAQAAAGVPENERYI
ncbi:MAG TPA: hypothetical protein ENG78_02395 [Acidiferrobacteraceae bacterium]|nr:hypothetical protein [Acidiferrobacteraceae bacterium]HEX19658.1 hypothetical protein [Acidiferrobacteraceae bacterium]